MKCDEPGRRYDLPGKQDKVSSRGRRDPEKLREASGEWGETVCWRGPCTWAYGGLQRLLIPYLFIWACVGDATGTVPWRVKCKAFQATPYLVATCTPHTLTLLSSIFFFYSTHHLLTYYITCLFVVYLASSTEDFHRSLLSGSQCIINA